MPDAFDMTFAQSMSALQGLEVKSRARAELQASLPLAQAATLADQAALANPQVARSYPGAVAAAAASGDQANVDAVVQGGTQAKTQSGDWWNPGDIMSAVGSALSTASQVTSQATHDAMGAVVNAADVGLSAAGSALDTATLGAAGVVGGDVIQPTIRGITAGAQSAWQFAQNAYANRAPMSSDVIQGTLNPTAASNQANTERLQRISGGLTDPGGVVTAAQATDVGQIATQALNTGSVDMGAGFFPGASVATGQQAAALDVRGAVPGSQTFGPSGHGPQANTIGRSMAVQFTEPGTEPYNFLSGAVDAAAMMAGDPVLKLHPLAGRLSGGAEAGLVDNSTLGTEIKNTASETGSWLANHPQATDEVKTLAQQAVDQVHQAADARNVQGVKDATSTLADLVRRTEPASATEADKWAAGLVDGLRKTVDLPTTEQWIQSNNDVLQQFADDHSFASVFHRLGGKVDPRIALSIADADTAPKVADIFRQALGGEIPAGPGLAYRGVLGEATSKFHDWVADHRMFADMPGEESILNPRGASSQTLAQSMKIFEDNLINVRVPMATRDALMEEYARGLAGTNQQAYDAGVAGLKAVRTQMTYGMTSAEMQAADAARAAGEAFDPAQAAAFDVRRDVAQQIGTGLKTSRDGISAYATRAMGNDTDNGLAQALADAAAQPGMGPIPGLPDLVPSQVVSPISLEQGVRQAMSWPDARVARRLTSSPIMRAITTAGPEGRIARLFGRAVDDPNSWGQPRVPWAALDFMTTNLFKRPAVLRLAFIPRVIGEEMVYLGAAGGPSPFTHPLHFIGMAMSKAKNEDALGADWLRASGGTSPKDLNEFQNAINVGTDLSDPYASTRLTYASGDASIATKANKVPWMQGHSDYMGAMNSNEIKRMIASGSTTDDIMAYLRSDAGSSDLNNLQDMLNRKGLLYDQGGVKTRMKLDLSSDANLRTYIDTNQRGDVKAIAGDNPALLEAIATGHLGSEEIPVANTEIKGVIKRADDGGWVGSQVRLKDGRLGTISAEPVTGQSTVQLGAPAWTNREASSALQDALSDWHANPDSSPDVRVWTRPALRQANTDGSAVSNAMKSVTRVFFGHLFGQSSDYLVRSPFFRQTYWDNMEQMAPNLTPEAANQMLHNLDRQVAETPAWADDGQLSRILDKARNANGNLDLEAADSLAKGRALDTMHDTFYDWSRKSQFFDITRNIFPFGSAWAKMLERYGSLLREDPVTTLHKANLFVNGVQGSGFFTRDPQSGNEKFNIPLVGALAAIAPTLQPGGDALTGANATASLQGLTLGTDIIPGLGPAAQLAVSNLLPDTPDNQGLSNLLFPHGRPRGSPTSLLPSYLQNAFSAIEDKRNTTRLYGNDYIKVLESKAASGDYDLSKQSEVSRMMDDAAGSARWLSLMDVVTQFTSPSSPTFDVAAKTKQGDVLSAMLVDDLTKMRAADPTGFTTDFITKYGENAFIYLQGKTRAVLGGLDSSTVFGDWQKTHQDVIQQHPDVAGYFAPTGPTFDSAVFQRQIANGQRTYLTDRQIIDAAQETMGRWAYDSVKNAIGAKPTAAQSLQLSEYRTLLGKRYPGYDPTGNMIPSETAHRVDELRDAMAMPELAKTNVGLALHSYFAVRDAVQAQAVKAGVQSFTQANQFASQRDGLRSLGDLLAQKYPEFARVWSDVLEREMRNDPAPAPTTPVAVPAP